MSGKDRTNEFIKLIREHEKIIYKVCSFYTGNRDDMQDLFQEIVLQAWGAFPRFRGDSQPGTWLYRISLNTAVSFFRREKKRSLIDVHEFKLEFFSSNAVQETQSRLLHEIIADLNKLEKAIMLLYLEDRKYAEIAEIMGISESNVGTRINRIKEKLRLRAKEKLELANK